MISDQFIYHSEYLENSSCDLIVVRVAGLAKDSGFKSRKGGGIRKLKCFCTTS